MTLLRVFLAQCASIYLVLAVIALPNDQLVAQTLGAKRNMSPELAKALLQDATSVARLTAEGKLLHESNPNPRTWGQYCGSAWNLNEQGEFRKAIQMASMALFVGSIDLYREAAFAFAKRDLAVSYSYAGHLEVAERFATESIAHNAGSFYADVWSVSYKTLGDIAMRRGQFDKAIEHYRKAENYSSISWRRLVRVSLVNAYSLAGRKDDAAKLFGDVRSYTQPTLKPQVARLAGELHLRDGKFDDAITQFRAYAAAVEKEDADYHRVWALDGEARATAAKGDQAGAVELYMAATKLAENVRSQFRSDEFKTGLFGEMESIYSRAVKGLAGLGKSDLAFEVAESSRARALADQVRGRVALKKLVAASPQSPETKTSIDSVQRLLGSNDVLVEYFVADDATYAWVIEQSGRRMVTLSVGANAVRGMVQSFRTSVVERGNDVRDLGKRIHDTIFSPLAVPPGRNLIVVPHDALHHLPFQALWNGKAFLIEERAISYFPAASVMIEVLGANSSSKRRQIVAFGNPDLGNSELALPGAEREVQQIKAVFPDATVVTGRAATKARFIAEAPKHSLVHVAAHAEFDSVDPIYSHVRLASEKDESGMLEAREIFGMPLGESSLIVLSACESGMTRVSRGDEIWGFARSFFAAGAPAVLLSLWPVADEATERLMSGFYKELAGNPTREAIRRAQLKLMGLPEFEHPFFWAAFNLSGDWR